MGKLQQATKQKTSSKHEKLTDRAIEIHFTFGCKRRGRTTQICIIEKKNLMISICGELKTIRF